MRRTETVLPCRLARAAVVWLFAVSACLSQAAEGEAPVARGREVRAERPAPLARGRPRAVRGRVDAGDEYALADGRKVRLLRVADEACVRFADGVTPEEGVARLEQDGGLPALERVAALRKGAGRTAEILRTQGAALSARQLAGSARVAWAYPVLFDEASQCRMALTDEVVVQLAEGATLADLGETFAAARVEPAGRAAAPELNIHVLRLLKPKEDDPLGVARALAATGRVRWANPNFQRELRRHFTPNDTHYGKQQDKHNTGQNGCVADADIDAPEAWNVSTGAASVVIAIIDDGVDTGHSDVRIHLNAGETGGGKESNGVDDDGNGYVDDWRGWNFMGGNNNPSPVGDDGHGTACAGVAAATINNASLVAGAAGGCSVLPVKISQGSGFASDSAIASALTYAANRADVISCSWGGGSSVAVIDAAIQYALTSGRGGKGCPVFCATGNNMSRWNNGGSRFRISLAGYSGTYYLGFCFYRGSFNSGENMVKVDDVCLLDSDGYTQQTTVLPRQDFESTTFPPAGWSQLNDLGTALWLWSGTSPKSGTGGAYSARSPSPSAEAYSADLLTPALSLTGNETLAFDYYESAGNNSAFFVDIYNSSKRYLDSVVSIYTYNPALDTAITYPASLTGTIAVGASTDCDRRSDYSQYGTGLDFLAPSNGGWNDVPSLDPTGAVGWVAGNLSMDFGGTSSAAPLAAGIGALVLAVNPALRAADVRSILRKSCDKVGGATYSGGDAGAGGWNSEYGYGRINAHTAVRYAQASAPQLSAQSVTVDEGGAAGFSVWLAAQPPTNVTVTTVWQSGSAALAVSVGASLTFTTSNWNAAQTVTLAAAENADATNSVARFACSAMGYAPVIVTATEADDDFVLSVTSGGNGTVSGGGQKDRDSAPFAITASPNAGYRFKVWSGPDAAKVADTNAAATTIQTATAASVTALFEAVVTCTVTFDAQGGSASPATATVTNGQAYGALPVPSREHYAFGGWWTAAGGAGSPVTAATVVTQTANHALYAKWTQVTTAQGTPCAWLDLYGLAPGGGYEAADLADQDLDGMAAWEEYVAGTVPTSAVSRLRARITGSAGLRRVGWEPDLTGAVPARVYSVFGVSNLLLAFPPAPVTNNLAPGASVPVDALGPLRFFKVGVELQP